MSQSRTIAFLLGSGASIPAGYPRMDEITSLVLLGDGIRRHTDGTYYIDVSINDGMRVFDNYAHRVVLILNRLKIEIEKYYLYDFNTTINYEDLFYLCSQIHDNELREFENPIVGSFMDLLSDDIDKIRYYHIGEPHDHWETHQ